MPENRREIETGKETRIEIWDTEQGTVGVYHDLRIEADTEADLRAKINWLAYHGI